MEEQIHPSRLNSKDVDEINDVAYNLFQSSEERTYTSIDSVELDENPTFWPTEYLNTLKPSGMPPHSI